MVGIVSVAEEFRDGVVCPSSGAGGRIDLEVVHCMEELGWGDLKGGRGLEEVRGGRLGRLGRGGGRRQLIGGRGC